VGARRRCTCTSLCMSSSCASVSLGPARREWYSKLSRKRGKRGHGGDARTRKETMKKKSFCHGLAGCSQLLLLYMVIAPLLAHCQSVNIPSPTHVPSLSHRPATAPLPRAAAPPLDPRKSILFCQLVPVPTSSFLILVLTSTFTE
jgi:hypothetical protein